MKHLLLTTIAAVLVVGCGEPQQSAPVPETKPVKPVAEAAQSEPPTAKAPDISIHQAAIDGDIEAIKQHTAAGTDVNAEDDDGWTPMHRAVYYGRKEIVGLLIANGGDVNATDVGGGTPLHYAIDDGHKEVAELLIIKGADVNAKNVDGETPLDLAKEVSEEASLEYKAAKKETADLLRKHGGKTSEELEA